MGEVGADGSWQLAYVPDGRPDPPGLVSYVQHLDQKLRIHSVADQDEAETLKTEKKRFQKTFLDAGQPGEPLIGLRDQLLSVQGIDGFLLPSFLHEMTSLFAHDISPVCCHFGCT